jgi:hypothetical protein
MLNKTKTIKIQSVISHNSKTFQVDVKTVFCDGIGYYITGVSDEQSKPILMAAMTAVQAAGYKLPIGRMLISIDGFYDDWNSEYLHLPIAVSMIALQYDLVFDTKKYFLSGMLSLDAKIKDVPDARDITDIAKRLGRKIFLPKVQYIQGLTTFQDYAVPVDDLKDVINHLDIF